MILRLYHKTLITLHIVLIAAVIFLCVGGFILGNHLNQTLTLIDSDATDLHITLTAINKPDSGTLVSMDKLIYTSKSVLTHTDMFLNHEDKQLSTLDNQEATLFSDFHNVATNANIELTSFNETTKSATKATDALTSDLNKFPPMIDNFDNLILDTDTQINDPSINKILNSMANTGVQIEGITTNTNKVTTHLEQVIDSPKKKTTWQKIQTVWGIIWQIAMIAK
jgi:hypothetical protein